jgi:hypothetical protein
MCSRHPFLAESVSALSVHGGFRPTASMLDF